MAMMERKRIMNDSSVSRTWQTTSLADQFLGSGRFVS
jgi:hypothetical protein